MRPIALLALAFAGSAAAQTPAPEPAKGEPAARPSLNLRLDDASRSAAPRITFERPAAATTKDEREKGLPEMGGKPALSFDRPINPNNSNSPIPKAYDPAGN